MRTGPRAVGILAGASPAWAALVAALDELAEADQSPPCATFERGRNQTREVHPCPDT